MINGVFLSVKSHIVVDRCLLGILAGY
jgi:hypothetical protein